MKPRRTSLPSDAGPGSVRTPAAPTPSVDAAPSPSAALRERLTQTRARMARQQAKKALQINIDWDPEELPTRHYKGEPLVPPWRAWSQDESPAQRRTRLGSGEVSVQREPSASPPPRGRARSGEVAIDMRTRTSAPANEELARAISATETWNDWPSAREALDPEAFPDGNGEVHAHSQQVPEPNPRTRARSGEMLIGARFGDPTTVAPNASDALDPAAFPGRPTPAPLLHSEPDLSPHISPISERSTQAPIALVIRRELSALREHLQAFYASLDHSEQALRDRVALCSGGLLLAAALSLLFTHTQSPEAQWSKAPSAAIVPKSPALPRNASITISSDPAGAEIFLDGRASGKVTPATIGELTPGKHRIGLQLAGYRETTEALHLPEDALLSIKLASLNQPRVPAQTLEPRPQTAAEARAQARERRAAARAARAISRYRARMGLPTQEP